MAHSLYERFTKLIPHATLVNLYGSSEVAADVTCFDTSSTSLRGFVPIGNISFGGFKGTFDGQNNTIDGLVIAPTDPSVNNIGLFATITANGSVSNLTLSNVSISANSNPDVGSFQSISALAGQNWGQINNVSVTSTGERSFDAKAADA